MSNKLYFAALVAFSSSVGFAGGKSFDRYEKPCWKGETNQDLAYRKDKDRLLLIWDKIHYLVNEKDKLVYLMNSDGHFEKETFLWPKSSPYKGVDVLDEVVMGKGLYEVSFKEKSLTLIRPDQKKKLEVNLEACRHH